MDGAGQDPLRLAGRCRVRCLQGIRKCRDQRHRRSPIPSGPEIGGGGLGCSNQPIDPREGVANSTCKGRKGPKARGDKDSRSPQIDRSPREARPELGGSGNQGPDLQLGGGKNQECHQPQVNPHLCGLLRQGGDYLGGNEGPFRCPEPFLPR